MYSAATVEARPVSRMFKALGDETRVRIVALLSHGELCVCHIEAALGLSQPTASRQLAVLRSAGIVEDRKEGTWSYYRIAAQPDPDRKRVLRALLTSYEKRDDLRHDVERLLKAKGPTSCR